MNDNNAEFHRDRRHAAQLVALANLNIGANGRWFTLALIGIAVAAGQLKLAVLYAMLLGLSVILEQVVAPWRAAAAYILYAWGAIGAVWLLVIV